MLLYCLLLASLGCRNDPNSAKTTSENSEGAVNELSKKYKILKIQPSETSSKAQVTCYAYLTTDSISEDLLSSILTKIYDELKYYTGFSRPTIPNVIAVYLYTSKYKAEEMSGSWIAMLSKTPSDTQPKITYDNIQISPTSEKEEKEYLELSNYLKERGTDLCFIYTSLYEIEGKTIKEADAKYPNYGSEHLEYQKKRYAQEKSKLFKKYRIDEKKSSNIIMFGMKHCK